MKRVFAVFLSLLFFVTLSFAVVGCQKAEEKKPAEPVKQEAPAPVPAAPAAAPAAPAPAAK